MDVGIIFHIGLYSVYGFDSVNSAKRRNIMNGSEWYIERLSVNEKTFRPVSGWKETQEFHKKNFNNQNYYDAKLNITKKEIKKWMKTCKNFKYVILTSKHHDGFCLWDTKTTDLKYNILDMFKKYAKKYDLVFGIYYSWLEFGKPFTVKSSHILKKFVFHNCQNYRNLTQNISGWTAMIKNILVKMLIEIFLRFI